MVEPSLFCLSNKKRKLLLEAEETKMRGVQMMALIAFPSSNALFFIMQKDVLDENWRRSSIFQTFVCYNR